VVREVEGSSARIDALLMSCRVLGRGVEKAFFDRLVRLLQAQGVTTVVAEYRKTAKNTQVAAFYDALGFTPTAHESAQTSYALSIAQYQPNSIDYIDVTENHGRSS